MHFYNFNHGSSNNQLSCKNLIAAFCFHIIAKSSLPTGSIFKIVNRFLIDFK